MPPHANGVSRTLSATSATVSPKLFDGAWRVAKSSSTGGVNPMSVSARIVKSRPRRERSSGTINATIVREATTQNSNASTIATAINTADTKL